jgi:protein SCO1/2
MQNNRMILGVCAIAITLLAGYFFMKNAKQEPIRHLPFYRGLKNIQLPDSVVHEVPDFSFLNQEGKTITKKNIAGKIYVADYFFTTCQSICPVMKKQMNRVYKEFLNDSEVVFLSHTVDPETDTVATMKEFAQRFNADPKKWMFLTGGKKELYDQARNGYFLDPSTGNGDADDFIHTQNFALVDKNFHIRGYYDGTDSADVNRLITEIKVLKMEYNQK